MFDHRFSVAGSCNSSRRQQSVFYKFLKLKETKIKHGYKVMEK